MDPGNQIYIDGRAVCEIQAPDYCAWVESSEKIFGKNKCVLKNMNTVGNVYKVNTNRPYSFKYQTCGFVLEPVLLKFKYSADYTG